MTVFRPSRAYRPDLDIRFADGRVPAWSRPLVEAEQPNADAWLVIMPRRSGKTWLARAVEHTRAGTAAGNSAGNTAGNTAGNAPGGGAGTVRVDLRSPLSVTRAGLGCLLGAPGAPELPEDTLVLIDEPALAWPAGARGAGAVSPAVLVGGLAALRAAGAVPVLFATPAEHALLTPHLAADAPRDLLWPPELDDEECARLAARAPGWAPALVAGLRQRAPGWLRTPFLLELMLQTAETHAHLRTDLRGLARAACAEAEQRHQYIDQWFGNGLTAGHRAGLRRGRWRRAGLEVPETETAAESRTAAGAVPAALHGLADDPALERHLPEVLRIHHITDLHHGGELRATVDAKDTSGTGQLLAALAGAGSPLDSYLGHLRLLADQGRAPHLVILTGDVVDRPYDEYGEQALAWLRELTGLLAGHPDLRDGDPRVLLTGGNHDVSWDLALDERLAARHEWFARTFAAYPHPDLHLADHGQRRLYITFPEAGLRVALLGSAESGGEVASDLDRDRAAARAAQGGAQEVRGEVMGYGRHDPGIVVRRVLDRLSPEAGYLTLAALHHPLSPVPSVEIAPYSGVVNAGQAKKALAAAGAALVLHGHTHLGFTAAERLLGGGPPWTLRIAGAPALGSGETEEQNGYNEVFVAREGGAHTVALRTVRLRGGHWTPDPAVAFRPGAAEECSLGRICEDGA
ncbi:metallophosphoesterase [Streptomyces aidingensis]|uniref:3',5'-cyclic AMP phosphodiesterase CpdA n=1 Tax=Streptomyces aidingensis TaxID=910347 RepID=A0A1I1SGD9_9ACTN|nr:metallophosphoesterase [Streptomyces aidingensis]SFD45521.1 3',5'-cyclic AMP phosphodiesterase CpdA [Streptomyces aidingensis]